MLAEDHFVVVEQSPKSVSQLVDFVVARRAAMQLLASHIRPLTEAIERIALYEHSGKATLGMSHHSRVRLV